MHATKYINILQNIGGTIYDIYTSYSLNATYLASMQSAQSRCDHHNRISQYCCKSKAAR